VRNCSTPRRVAVTVGTDEPRRSPCSSAPGELREHGSSAGTLQTGEHHDRRRLRAHRRFVVSPPRMFVSSSLNDLDDLLLLVRSASSPSADGALAHPSTKCLLATRALNVGLRSARGAAHFQCPSTVAFRELPTRCRLGLNIPSKRSDRLSTYGAGYPAAFSRQSGDRSSARRGIARTRAQRRSPSDADTNRQAAFGVFRIVVAPPCAASFEQSRRVIRRGFDSMRSPTCSPTRRVSHRMSSSSGWGARCLALQCRRAW